MENKDLFDIIKPGDYIRLKKTCEVYKVEGFYENKYGAVLVDSDGNKNRVYSKIISRDFEMEVPLYDNVNNPAHYASGGIECIDAMIAAYGEEVVMHFCQGNTFKYQWRFDKKNGIEDLKKAQWYMNKYIELKNKN